MAVAAETFTLRYRFLIIQGPMPDAAEVQAVWDQFAGAQQPSPVPTVSVIQAKPK